MQSALYSTLGIPTSQNQRYTNFGVSKIPNRKFARLHSKLEVSRLPISAPYVVARSTPHYQKTHRAEGRFTPRASRGEIYTTRKQIAFGGYSALQQPPSEGKDCDWQYLVPCLN